MTVSGGYGDAAAGRGRGVKRPADAGVPGSVPVEVLAKRARGDGALAIIGGGGGGGGAGGGGGLVDVACASAAVATSPETGRGKHGGHRQGTKNYVKDEAAFLVAYLQACCLAFGARLGARGRGARAPASGGRECMWCVPFCVCLCFCFRGDGGACCARGGVGCTLAAPCACVRRSHCAHAA